jgi:hypothetical protein
MLNKYHMFLLLLLFVMFISCGIFAQVKKTNERTISSVTNRSDVVIGSEVMLVNSSDNTKNESYKPNTDWKAIIDSYWGVGQPATD